MVLEARKRTLVMIIVGDVLDVDGSLCPIFQQGQAKILNNGCIPGKNLYH